jgi:hypothetical protein
VNLTDEQIQGFIQAWKNDFDETLTPEVARMEANRLLDFFVWMCEELGTEEALKKLEPTTPEEDDLKKAWRKTMGRRS